MLTGIQFGTATAGRTFDNSAGLGGTTVPQVTVTALSTAGFNGAFLNPRGIETGSPGIRLNSTLLTGLDLSQYVRIGRYDLPEPTRTSAPPNSVLAQEVSAVTWNWDTDTLFVVGDGGTSIVQVSKTGTLIDSMTLAPGSSPQGTEFYDPEGLAYVGAGKFVLAEERDRRLVRFTYAAGTTLSRVNAETVHVGTFVDNIGIEGITYDPRTLGFIAVKESNPQGIFQTNVDFAAGTATNGSPTAVNSTNLFDPALLNLADLADVFALSNLPSLNGPDTSHLLILSQESGRILHTDRAGNVYNALTIRRDLGNPLSVPAQQHEGLAMDGNGILYVVSENGGGDFDHPQLWVYAPATQPNQAPSDLLLTNQINSLPESTNTAARVQVADVFVIDDGLGANSLTVVGADAGIFEVDENGLYVKAGVSLDFETKSSYTIEVYVDDPTLGTNPDASARFTLTVTDVEEVPSTVIISEIAPWASGNSPARADWFEVTNIGPLPVNIAGWRMDDGSDSFADSVALNGPTSIAPGESVIFMETAALATAAAAFRNTWFTTVPVGLQIGSYSGGGVGLSTDGDGVVLFDASGVRQAKVTFGASSTGTFRSFDNAAGVNNGAVNQLSTPGGYGAYVAPHDSAEIGSPGVTGRLVVSEVAPWASSNSPGLADWFEVTNTGPRAVDITGWKVDDSSESLAAAAALNGITTIAAGESVIFIETANLAAAKETFLSTWFGAQRPAHLQVGGYSGGGIGLSTTADAIVLFNAAGGIHTKVTFGAAATGPFATFDNTEGIHNGALVSLSAIGVNAAFAAAQDAGEIGSPGLRWLEAQSLTVVRGGVVYNRATRQFVQQVNVRNDSSSLVAGPIHLVLDGLSTNATLANASGTTSIRPPFNSPYLTVIPATATLAPGASATIVLQFTNPSMAAISYSARPLVASVP